MAILLCPFLNIANATQHESLMELEGHRQTHENPACRKRNDTNASCGVRLISYSSPSLQATSNGINGNITAVKECADGFTHNGQNIDSSQPINEENGKSTLDKLLEKVRLDVGNGKAEVFGAETVKKLANVIQNQV